MKELFRKIFGKAGLTTRPVEKRTDEFSSFFHSYTPAQKIQVIKEIVSKSSQDQRDLVDNFNRMSR